VFVLILLGAYYLLIKGSLTDKHTNIYGFIMEGTLLLLTTASFCTIRFMLSKYHNYEFQSNKKQFGIFFTVIFLMQSYFLIYDIYDASSDNVVNKNSFTRQCTNKGLPSQIPSILA